MTKQATAAEGTTMEWIDDNLRARTTMKYPSILLNGRGAMGGMAGKCQDQDTGAKMIHNAPNTSSSIIYKSIVKGGGEVNYRGQVTFGKNSSGSISHIECDTIIMGFVEPFSKELPMEYAAELNRLIAYEMEGAVG